MLRCGQKRRRTKTEIHEEKEEARLKQDAIEEKLARFDELLAKNEELERDVIQHQGASMILGDLESKGKIHIAKSGDVLVPGVDEIPFE